MPEETTIEEIKESEKKREFSKKEEEGSSWYLLIWARAPSKKMMEVS